MLLYWTLLLHWELAGTSLRLQGVASGSPQVGERTVLLGAYLVYLRELAQNRVVEITVLTLPAAKLAVRASSAVFPTLFWVVFVAVAS